MPRLTCQECLVPSGYDALGWRAYRGDLPEDPEPILLFYCPSCALREFGPSRTAEDRPTGSPQ